MIRILLILIAFFIALTALSCGAMLVISPDGALLQMSPSGLAGTPFHNYLIPGLVLALVVGGSALWALILVAFRQARAQQIVILSGVMLGGWITVQTLLIGASHFLQAVYFILAVIVFVIGVFYKTAFIKKNA